jgi:hypothetical protein
MIVTGFTVSLPEYPATIPTLWDTVKGDFRLGFPLSGGEQPSQSSSTEILALCPRKTLWRSYLMMGAKRITDVTVSYSTYMIFLDELFPQSGVTLR